LSFSYKDTASNYIQKITVSQDIKGIFKKIIINMVESLC
jgi:hypothetical protein